MFHNTNDLTSAIYRFVLYISLNVIIVSVATCNYYMILYDKIYISRCPKNSIIIIYYTYKRVLQTNNVCTMTIMQI